jgi:hypothetical protein
MTIEQELREVLAKYGIGLMIHEFAKNDRVNIYPTRYKGIHKMQLNLRGKLATCQLSDLLKHCLSDADFKDWRASLVDGQLEVKKQ